MLRVHGELEAGPEEHVRRVDIAVRDGDLAALQLECAVLVQAHAEEESETVVGGFDEGFRVGGAEGEGGGEDGGEGAGDLVVGLGGGEECG